MDFTPFKKPNILFTNHWMRDEKIVWFWTWNNIAHFIGITSFAAHF